MPHVWLDYITRTVFFCSIAHTMLPPWEFLNDFPRIQKVYKAAVYAMGWIAINGRSTVYRSLSTDNGTKTSKAANGHANGGNGGT